VPDGKNRDNIKIGQEVELFKTRSEKWRSDQWICEKDIDQICISSAWYKVSLETGEAGRVWEIFEE